MFSPGGILYIGIPEIDQAHERLDRLIKDIGVMLITNAPVAGIRRLCLQLTAALKEHFAEEERLLAPYGLKNMAAHRDEHQRLVQELTNTGESISMASNEWRNGLMDLSDILTRHIITFDFAVIPCLDKAK